MKIRQSLAAAAMAVGLMAGGTAVSAAPAFAADIPTTYNGGTKTYYSYKDSTNRFCISRTAGAPVVSVGIYDTNGYLAHVLVDRYVDGTSVCTTLSASRFRENATFRFQLQNADGAVSWGRTTV